MRAPVALVAHWQDGRVKQAVIRRALALRREVPDLFARGEYRPVEVMGPLARACRGVCPIARGCALHGCGAATGGQADRSAGH